MDGAKAELELLERILHADAADEREQCSRLLTVYRRACLALRPSLLRAKLAAQVVEDMERWGGVDERTAALEAWDAACREVRANASGLFAAAIGAATKEG